MRMRLLVKSVDVVARAENTASWCSIDVAMRVSDFVDWSPLCSLERGIIKDQVYLVKRIMHRDGTDQSTTIHGRIPTSLESAAQRGCINVIKWIVTNHPELVGKARLMDKAAAGGHLELLEWLYHRERKDECTCLSVNSMDAAASNGFLAVVEWLHQLKDGPGCTHRALDGAAANGHLQVVKWLHHNRTEGCSTDAMDDAARNGHLHIVQFLHLHRREGCSRSAIAYAADRGHLAIVQFLLENRAEQREHAASALAHAAWRKHTAVVHYLSRARIMSTATDTNGQGDTIEGVYLAQWLLELHEATSD